MMRSRSWRLASVALVVVLAAGGCQDGTETQPSASTQSGKPMPQASPSAHTYDVRGVVTSLPTAKDPELYVHHEAIPDFIDMGGQKTGMASMTMPFDLAPGVSAADLHVGDKITMTLVVNWDKNLSEVTKLEKLPADTQLTLGMKHMTTMPATTRAK